MAKESRSFFPVPTDLDCAHNNAVPDSLEFLIVDELLHLLLGISTDHFAFVQHGGWSIQSTSLNLDISVRDVVEKLMPLCCSYRNLSEKTEIGVVVPGLVLQALCSAIAIICAEYRMFILDMEQQWRERQLSLEKMWLFLQTPLQVICVVDRIFRVVDFDQAQTIQLLTEEQALNKRNPKGQVYRFLLERCMAPIGTMTELFITKGQLRDAHQEYFIREHKSRELLGCWTDRFSFRSSQIPNILTECAIKILETGRNMSVLSQLGVVLDHGNGSTQFIDSEFQQHLIKCWEQSNRLLVDLVIRSNNFLEELESIKNMFLVQHGDAASLFLEQSLPELIKSASHVDLQKIGDVFDFYFGQGGAYKLVMSRQSLLDQLTEILSAAKNRDRKPKENRELTGLLGLCLETVVPFPLSLVFPSGSQTKYQIIFRFLIRILLVQDRLCRSLVRGTPNRSEIMLKVKMEYFLNVTTQYFQHQVITFQWNRFKSDISQSESIDEALVLHSKFLDGCLKDLFLSNWKLYRIFDKLCSACLVLADLANLPMDTTLQLQKLEINFMFHIKLFIETLQTISRTEYNRLMGLLALELQNGFSI